MDTLTHALSGALLARVFVVRGQAHSGGIAGPAHPTRGAALQPWQAVTVGAVAAAFPDIDFVAQLAGEWAYLRHHRGITHSVPLAPLWAALLAAWIARWFGATRSAGGWRRLYPLVLGALLIHIAGDWITQFGTLMLAPFSDRRFGLGAVFIIDLVFTGLLVAGLALAAIWPGRRWPATVALLAVCAWVGLCWSGRQEALEAGARHAAAIGLPVRWIEAMPRPASPFNWTVTVFDGQRHHVAHLNTRRSEPLVAREGDGFVRRFSAPYLPTRMARWEAAYPLGAPGTPAWVAEVWQHEAMTTYRWFAAAPVLARVEERRDGAGMPLRCALFEDLRFRTPGREDAPFRYGLCLGAGSAAAQAVRLDGDAVVPL